MSSVSKKDDNESVGCDACGNKDAHLDCDFCHRPDVKYCSRECRSGLGWVKHEGDCNVVRSEQLCATPYAWQNLAPHDAWETKMQDEAIGAGICNRFPSYLVKHDLPDQLTVTQTVIPAIRASKPIENEHSEEQRVKAHTFEVFVNGVSVAGKKPLSAPDAMISTHSTNAAAQRLVESRIARPQSRTYWIGTPAMAAGAAIAVKLGDRNVIELVRNGDKEKARRVEFFMPENAVEDFSEQVQQRLGQGLKGFWQEQMRWKGLGKQQGISSHHAFNPEMGDGVVLTVDKELKLVDLEFYVARDPKPVRLQQQTFQKTVDDSDSTDIQALAMALEDILEVNPRHEQAQLHLASLLDFFHNSQQQRDDAATLTKARVAIGGAIQTLNEHQAEFIGKSAKDAMVERYRKELSRMTANNMNSIYKQIEAELLGAAKNLKLARERKSQLRAEDQEKRGLKRLFGKGKIMWEQRQAGRSKLVLEAIGQAAGEKYAEYKGLGVALDDKQLPAYWVGQLRDLAEAAQRSEWAILGINSFIGDDAAAANQSPEYVRKIELKPIGDELIGANAKDRMASRYRKELSRLTSVSMESIFAKLWREARAAARNLRLARERKAQYRAENQEKRGLALFPGAFKTWIEQSEAGRSKLALEAMEQAVREKLNEYLMFKVNFADQTLPGYKLRALHAFIQSALGSEWDNLELDETIDSQLLPGYASSSAAAPIGAWFVMPNQPNNVIWLQSDDIDIKSQRDFDKKYAGTKTGTIRPKEDVLKENPAQSKSGAFWEKSRTGQKDKSGNPIYFRTGFQGGGVTLSPENSALLMGSSKSEEYLNVEVWLRQRMLKLKTEATYSPDKFNVEMQTHFNASKLTTDEKDRLRASYEKSIMEAAAANAKLSPSSEVEEESEPEEEDAPPLEEISPRKQPSSPYSKAMGLNEARYKMNQFLLSLARGTSFYTPSTFDDFAVPDFKKNLSEQDFNTLMEEFAQRISLAKAAWQNAQETPMEGSEEIVRKQGQPTKKVVAPSGYFGRIEKAYKYVRDHVASLASMTFDAAVQLLVDNFGISYWIAKAAVTAIGAGVTAAKGVVKSIDEKKTAKEAKKAMEEAAMEELEATPSEQSRNYPYRPGFVPSKDPSRPLPGERGNYYYGYDDNDKNMESRVRDAIGSLFPEHVEGHADFDALETHHVLSHDPELVQEVREAYSQYIGAKNDFTQKAFQDGLNKALEKCETNYTKKFARDKKAYENRLKREEKSIKRGEGRVERQEKRLDTRKKKVQQQREKNFDYGSHHMDDYYGGGEDEEF